MYLINILLIVFQKLRLKNDNRVQDVIFFADTYTIGVLLKDSINKVSSPEMKEESKNADEGKPNKQFLPKNNQYEKNEKFKGVATKQDFDNLRKQYGDMLIEFKVFQKIKVMVTTTTEFPLDIECTILFTEEDLHKAEEQMKLQREEKANDVLETAIIGDNPGMDI